MTKEKLLEWGLSEEQAAKVIAGLNGSFVTKARFNEVNAELARVKADNVQKDAVHAGQIKAMKIASAVDFALSAARAKNITAVRALMAGFIEKAEIAGDGSVVGLDEEIRRLVEGKDTAFLFDKAPERVFRGAKPAEKSDPAVMTLDKLRAMSPADRRDFSLNYPDEYRQLYYGGNA